MRKLLIATFLVFLSISNISAQKPDKLSSNQIYEKVQKLNFLGSALYIAAHPDDENTRLIAYLSNQVKARTAYLSLTRGDGGQNLIGPEIRELLGVIRTQELLAARNVDGGEQLFSRANDFGYSKHPDETFDIWDEKQVLSDVVRAIRTFKPDVIINRFDHRTPGTTHGHHTASAMLSVEAFDLAGNKDSFASQLKTLDTWQPKRLFFNTSWWFYGSQEKFAAADKSKMLNFDIGVYYPLKGLSNNEVASIASSQHLCQGFGRLTRRGTQQEYIEFLKGDFPKDKNDIFSGIDTSWNRVKGGKAIGRILNTIEANFNFINPASHVPKLMEAYQLVQNLEDEHWKAIKTKELKAIIEACLGLYIEASATANFSAPSEAISIKIEALNRSTTDVKLTGIMLAGNEKNILSESKSLANNEKFTTEENITIAANSSYTTPYWLLEKGSLGMYSVSDEHKIGKPESEHLDAVFNLTINTIPITITKSIVHRYSKPDKGELYQPFEIVPKVSANFKDKVIIFSNSKAKEIPVTIKAGKNNVEGMVSIQHPEGWQISPKQQEVFIEAKGDETTLVFKVTPPSTQSEGVLVPQVTIGNDVYTKELVEISYDHIPTQTVLLPSEAKVVRLNIQKSGDHIGYIQGAGDAIPESLQQIGYHVTEITPENITAASLEKFDAIVVGIRAYNTIETLKFKQRFLLEYVKNGGNLIVQYNTNRRLKVTDNLAPYTLKLSRDRVTDEHAEVSFLAKDHSLLNFPNKITKNDFDGWVQERGLYFPNEWADEFTPILSMHDKGDTAKTGSLLVAKYGKGNYIYTGLSFFRELPAGVPGAYKLFSNMISIGKEQVITTPELKN